MSAAMARSDRSKSGLATVWSSLLDLTCRLVTGLFRRPRRPAFSTEARTRLENHKVFEEIEGFRNRLVALSVPSIQAHDISPVAKTPMKVAVLVQSGIRRALELTDSMISDCNNSRFVPPFVSARAIFETALLLHDMADFVEDTTKSRDFTRVSDLDERLMKALVGSKAEGFGDPTRYQAPNVLTIAHRLSRQSKAFLDFYVGLSEFAHPNYSGMMGAYVTIDTEQNRADFPDSLDSTRIGASKYALLGASAGLGILVTTVERLERVLPDFTSLCEELIHGRGTWPANLHYPLCPPKK